MRHTLVNKLLQMALDGLFPQACILCGLRSAQPLPLCPGCKAEMTRNKQRCERCAIPMRTAAPICGQCLGKVHAFTACQAPWLYDEYMAYLIQRWKFHGERRLTPLLAQLWMEEASPAQNVDLLVPIPLHWRRRWQRGYNQSALLASELLRRRASLASGGIAENLLRRNRATPVQSGLNARQRARNLSGAFTALKRCDNLRIALVDDVLTTGATASEAASTLKEAGAREVHLWCLARTPAPEA